MPRSFSIARPWLSAIILIAVVSLTTGCALVGAVAHGEANNQCERGTRTFDDLEACKAKRKQVNDYVKRGKAQDEDFNLGPKKKP